MRREISARLARSPRSARARTIALARISPNNRKRVRSAGDQSRSDATDANESSPIGLSPTRSGNMRFDRIPCAATNSRSSVQDSGMSSGLRIVNPSPWRARPAQLGSSSVGPFRKAGMESAAKRATMFGVPSSSKSTMLPRSAPKKVTSRSIARSSSASNVSSAARRFAETSASVASKPSSAANPSVCTTPKFHQQWRDFVLMQIHHQVAPSFAAVVRPAPGDLRCAVAVRADGISPALAACRVAAAGPARAAGRKCLHNKTSASCSARLRRHAPR